MTVGCEECRIISDKEEEKLFEDRTLIAFLHKQPAVQGHVIVMPKEHYPILEQVPDETLQHLFEITHQLSATLFSALQAQGTNILFQNGVAAGQESAHCMLHILPRKQNDGLLRLWEPKQSTEQHLSAIAEVLGDQMSLLQQERKGAALQQLRKEADEEVSKTISAMARHMTRIP